MKKKKVYIIGAGISGLAAAYYLNKSRFDIEIFEASPFAGGRCRSFFDEFLGAEIDNGNHLILGANSNILGLIKELGTADRFYRFTGKFNFYNNLNGEKYSFNAPCPDIRRYGFKEIAQFYKFILKPQDTVLQSFKKAPKFYSEFINPVSRSILNTPSEVASGRMLRNVFWKIIKHGKKGFGYYYPKNGWGNALIEPLVKAVQDKGIKINFSHLVKELPQDGIVIIATPPQVAAKLADIKTPERFESIYNIHFKFKHELEPQIYGVVNALVEWFFVRKGMISTTFSAASALNELTDEVIVKNVWDIFLECFNLKETGIPPHRIIKEKRASFICSKAELKKRPGFEISQNNIFPCGDYVENNLPGTLEGVVMNAKNLSHHLNKNQANNSFF